MADFILTLGFYFSLIFVCFLGSYFLGSVIIQNHPAENDKPFQKIFFSAFIGQIALASSIAIFFTKGKSALTVFPILFIFYLVYSSKYQTLFQLNKIKNSVSFSWKRLGFAFLLISFAFLWSFFHIMSPDIAGFLQFPNALSSERDFHFYNTVGYFIKNTGIENYYHVNNLLSEDYRLPLPYHYYDIWLNNGVVSLFGGNALKTMYLVSRPLMLGTSFLGILSICEEYTAIKLKHIIYTAFFAFVGGITLIYLKTQFSFFEYIGFHYEFILSKTPHKASYFYSFIIAGFLLLKKEKWLLALIFFISLSIASFVALPAMLSICIILPLLLLFLKKTNWKQFLLFYTLIFISYLAFGILLQLGHEGNGISSSHSYTDVIKEYFKTNTLSSFFISKSKLNIQIICYYTVLYLLPLILYFLVHRKLSAFFSIKFLSLALIFLGGMLGWNILFLNLDGGQIFIHTSTVACNVVIFFILFEALNHNKIKYIANISLGLYVAFNLFYTIDNTRKDRVIYNPFSNEYLIQLKEITDNKKDLKIVASLRDPNHLTNTFHKTTIANIIGFQLNSFQNNFGFVGLDDLRIPYNDEDNANNMQNENRIRSGGFFHFVEALKTKGIHLSIEEYQAEFLKKYHVDYLILYKDFKLPQPINELVVKKIIDSKSGETFCVLKTK